MWKLVSGAWSIWTTLCTARVLVSKIVTRSLPLATYNRLPSALTATPTGVDCAAIGVPSTVLVAVLITDTLVEP